MNCVIPGCNLKVLCKMFNSLCRIGDELYIDPSPLQLSFRTVNSTKTAYAAVYYNAIFFSFYKIEEADIEDEKDRNCKVPMKAMLNIFRFNKHLEKNLESCKIEYKVDDVELKITFRFKHDLVDRYYVKVLVGESLNAIYPKNTFPNSLCDSNAVLHNAVQNFLKNDYEISIVAEERRLLLRNYVNDDLNCSKIMRTELNIHNSEFGEYRIAEPTEIRFSLKLFRAMLSFTVGFEFSTYVNFEKGGKPMVIIVKNDETFEAHFVLSTSKAGDRHSTTLKNPNESISQNKISNKRRRSDDEPSTSASKQERILLNNVEWENSEFTNGNNQENDVDNTFNNEREHVVKVVFARCFDPTLDPLSHNVLVEATDSENDD